MARIVQSLTQPTDKYDQTVQQSFVRDVDSIVTKLNTSYQKGLAGDGEYMMKIRRVIPDFLTQTGDARVTLNLKNYPTDAEASSSLGPFTSSTTTTKIDTRARARAISLKVDNTGRTQHWKLGTFRLDVQPDGRR